MKQSLLFTLIFLQSIYFSTSLFSAGLWNLERASKRLAAVSPKLQTSIKNISMSQEKLKSATTWPNPSFGIDINNKIGKEDGSGNYNPAAYSISQPIAFFRTSKQKNVSLANLEGTKYEAKLIRLTLEYELSLNFHNVQQKKAAFELAKKKRALVETSIGKNKNGRVVQFLTPLDKSRLQIAKSYARIEIESTQGEYNKEMAHLKGELQIPWTDDLEVTKLERITSIPSLNILQSSQEKHPLLQIFSYKIKGAKETIKLEKSKKHSDPILGLYAEDEFIDNKKQFVLGASITITPPIWNSNSSKINSAKIDEKTYTKQLVFQKKNLENRLLKSLAHLSHLIEIEENYRKIILPQSKQFLNLTIKSFSVGEANVLTLVDAYENHFKAQNDHLKAVKESWDELAEIRFLSTIFIEDKNSLEGSE